MKFGVHGELAGLQAIDHVHFPERPAAIHGYAVEAQREFKEFPIAAGPGKPAPDIPCVRLG